MIPYVTIDLSTVNGTFGNNIFYYRTYESSRIARALCGHTPDAVRGDDPVGPYRAPLCLFEIDDRIFVSCYRSVYEIHSRFMSMSVVKIGEGSGQSITLSKDFPSEVRTFVRRRANTYGLEVTIIDQFPEPTFDYLSLDDKEFDELVSSIVNEK